MNNPQINPVRQSPSSHCTERCYLATHILVLILVGIRTLAGGESDGSDQVWLKGYEEPWNLPRADISADKVLMHISRSGASGR